MFTTLPILALLTNLLLTLVTSEPAEQPPVPEPAVLAPVAVVAGRPTFADAVQLADTGRDAEALAAFQRLVSANPGDHEARLWIARLYERSGASARAEAVYRSVLLEDPTSVGAMIGVATVLLERGERAEAIAMLEQSEQLAPQNETVLATLARAHRQNGSDERAIGYLERTVALAPTEQHRLLLWDAQRVHRHRVEIRGFGEQYTDSTPDSRSGDIAINFRLTDTFRVVGRGQAQRKLGVREERGGLGVEWRWTPATTLRVHAVAGPDARVMPEWEYLGEIDYAYRGTRWSAAVRYFDFRGARETVISPAAAWPAWNGRLEISARYVFSVSEGGTLTGRQNGHSGYLRGAYRLYPRLWITLGYASGVEDFENFSIDRIGDFHANTGSAGIRLDLPTSTSFIAMYEHQWQRRNVTMGRATVSLAQSF